MPMKKTFISIVLAVSLLAATAPSIASTGSDIIYTESFLGGSLWQYDYTFYNTSNAGEYLYSVDLLFDQTATVNGLPLPTGWDGTIWTGQNQTDFIMTFSTGTSYDITAGSSLGGFSFTVDYQAGDISYNAYFDDHAGGISSSSGITAMAPEPVSTVLFLTGGALFAGRRYLKGREV